MLGGPSRGCRQARRPSPVGPDLLGDRDLLLTRGQVGAGRVLAAAVAGPGLRVELEAAGEAVAGVGRPVTTGLTLCDRVPRTALRGLRDRRPGLGAHAHDGRGGLGQDGLGAAVTPLGLDAVDAGDRVGDLALAGHAGLGDGALPSSASGSSVCLGRVVGLDRRLLGGGDAGDRHPGLGPTGVSGRAPRRPARPASRRVAPGTRPRSPRAR